MMEFIKKYLLDFIVANYVRILVALLLLGFFYLVFYITTSSLKKLKTEVFNAYPFDQYIPQSGNWSVNYFLIVVVLLGALIFFMLRGGFFLKPA